MQDSSADGPVVELDGVWKTFRGQAAVRDLSFAIPRGSVCGFLGPNGAGKTTTMRMILDVIRPDRGRVRVFGGPPGAPARGRVGFLAEERGLYKKMRTDAAIAFFGRLNGLKAGEAKRRARALLAENGLADAARKKVKALSKGMAQKVQILAALAHQPELVILDEPFSGLDPVNQQALEAFIRAQAARGATIVFSTHVMEHAERLCDRIILIAKGRKLYDGDLPGALEAAPRRVVLAAPPGVAIASALGGLAVTARPAPVTEDSPGLDGGMVWHVDLGPGVDAQDVLRACVAAGVALARFEPVRPHLHDAFVHFVRAAEGDAPAAPTPGAVHAIARAEAG